MLYLDKVFIPLELKQVLDLLKGYNVKLVGVLPTSSGFESYPFSLSFLVQCYCRCLSRENHPAYENQNPLMLMKQLIMFYTQFKDLQLKDLIPTNVQVEMTTQARLPSDLEFIIQEAVEYGFQNEEAIEDAVTKIEMYRQLFGTSSQH